MIHRDQEHQVSSPLTALRCSEQVLVYQPFLAAERSKAMAIPGPLGRQLLPPAPNQGHYNNQSYEGDGEDGGL